MKVEGVFCEAQKTWVTSDWFCCPDPYPYCYANRKCARKNWPGRGARRPLFPECIGKYGNQPDLICDACPWFGECVKETLR